jgi:hypothetical protein
MSSRRNEYACPHTRTTLPTRTISFSSVCSVRDASFRLAVLVLVVLVVLVVVVVLPLSSLPVFFELAAPLDGLFSLPPTLSAPLDPSPLSPSLPAAAAAAGPAEPVPVVRSSTGGEADVKGEK